MFHLGDKVKLSEFYINHYIGAEALKDKSGEVIGIDIRYISDEVLREQHSAYQRFISMYGKLDRYECITLRVKYHDNNCVYIMSQFGVDLIK